MIMKQEKIRIMAVEDNTADFRLLEEYLKEDSSADFEITRAESLKDALSLSSSKKFDIILLDLDLPDSMGMETLEKIYDKNRTIPINVLTGLTNEETGVLALSKNAQDYLIKGKFEKDALIKSIRYAIERKRLESLLHKKAEENQMILDSVPALVFFKDKENNFIRTNKAFEDTMGMPKEKLEGASLFDIFPEEQAEAFWKDDLEVINSGKAKCGIIETFQTKRGTRIAQTYKMPYFGELGNIAGVIGFTIDITELKRTEDEIIRLNKTMQALSHSAQIMMRAVSEKEYLNDVCKIVVEDCGHSMVWIGFAENDKNKSVRPVAQAGFDEGYIQELNITWADNERGRGPTGTAIRTGKPSVCRNMLTDPKFEPWRKEAVKRGYSSSLVLPLIDDNRTFGAVSIYSKTLDAFSEDEVQLLTELAKDLSYGIMSIRLRVYRDKAQEILMRDKETVERLVKERTNELLKTQLELEKAKRLSDIGTLAATVAHELRNPLATISMAAHNIKRKAKSPDIDKHLSNIDKKVAESDQIINNLLFYSRIRPPHYESVKVSDIIEESIDSIGQNRKKDAQIIRNIDSIRNTLIEADPFQIKEMLQNLLNNALDAVPANAGKIEITGACEGEFIKINVKDNGHGIEKESLARIFDPFFSTKAKGTGLGLSVCQQIVNLHGGFIHIESKVDKGTVVAVSLPIKRII